ncbi:MAG: 3-hydroxybutyryl-CoA dehydrogenase, partial [Gemmatimonadetes bacterium]|nr:3-hydroxybutyryl-CoA dehydrogenase [Gemmatimonadota bacterium]
MPSIRRLAVIGAGTMGHGIAQVAAMAGHRVTLFDVDFVAAETGLQRIRKNLDKGVQLGKVSDATRETTLAALRTSTELADAVVEADLVIEAAPESMELKRSIFADVEARVDPEAILASNTSSLSIATLASGLRHPSRLLGLHFFNPVHL